MRQYSISFYINIGLFTFLIDRCTKLYALFFCYDRPCTINQFLSFDVTFNRGISWGLFHGFSTIVFILISLFITIITLFLMWYSYDRYIQNKVILGEILVISGSLSNLIDRIYYYGVVDFILFSYNQWSWPVFNIADAAIVIGIGLILFEQGVKS